MPQMLLPIFTEKVTLINQLIGYAKRDERVYYFNGQRIAVNIEIGNPAAATQRYSKPTHR